ncbi:MAG: ATP-binding protein [Cyanobacteria bacterium P01_H01_bin.130]
MLETHAERGLSQGGSVIRPLRQFLDEYEVWIESVWWGLPSVESASAEISTQLQQEQMAILAARIDGEQGQSLAVQLRRLSRQLHHLGVAASEMEEQAILEYQAANDVRFWLIVLSLTVSTLLAVVCAIVITRAIARPINQVTAQTHRVTREQDFKLRISVDSKNDEIAQLARSIDQLVSWAGQYTDELQTAQNTLEQRVEERTQELRIAQSQMVQSEKMSSLGQMVAGVAHEINNPVGFIYSNVSHAREYVDDLLALLSLYRQELEASEAGGPSSAIAEKEEEIDLSFLREDVVKLLGSMKSGAERIKQIVLSLRTFSRLDEAELKYADLHQGLESTVTLLEHRLRGTTSMANDIEVVRDYGDLPPVQCYAGQLNQVFMNLLTNAIDALEDGRKRSSRLHLVEPGAQRPPQITITTRTSGDRCIIAISDNGPGIPPETRARIFDPFFTTKPIGKGTGMGLAVSYQIIADRHKGQLTCTSRPGEGSTLTLEIPIALGLSTMDESSLAS